MMDREQRLAYQRDYYAKNREAVLGKRRVHYAANRDRIQEQRRKSLAVSPDRQARLKAYAQKYSRENSQRLSANGRQWTLALKLEVFGHYSGGEPECRHCGNVRMDALTIDHVAQNGADERRGGQGRGKGLWSNLRRRGFPEGYRVLCYNCNYRAWREYKALHLSQNPQAIRSRTYRAKERQGVIEAYGGKCASCGELDVQVLDLDHVDGSGARFRAETGLDGWKLYAYLRQGGYPAGNYQLLCKNCNRLKGATCQV